MALSRSIGYTFTITRAHRVLPAVQDLFAEESDLYLDEVVCTRLAFEHNIIISPSNFLAISNKLVRLRGRFYKFAIEAKTNIPMRDFTDGRRERAMLTDASKGLVLTMCRYDCGRL